MIGKNRYNANRLISCHCLTQGRIAMKPPLTVDLLCTEANLFAQIESQQSDPNLYGVTDGKAVGTYFEVKFQKYLREKYIYTTDNAAKGMDFPDLLVDMKVTSRKQPQSSCPFRAARQKIFGLGYSLLVFVYDKTDNSITQTSRLDVRNVIFVDQARTADFQTTMGIHKIIENAGNIDDLVAFMQERYLPIDDIQAYQLAEEILNNPPQIGYLTISNALQWRLQYQRVIDSAGNINGILRIF